MPFVKESCKIDTFLIKDCNVHNKYFCGCKNFTELNTVIPVCYHFERKRSSILFKYTWYLRHRHVWSCPKLYFCCRMVKYY